MKFLNAILIILCWATGALAQDWSLPITTSDYTDVLTELKGRDVDVATMDYTGSTNIPTGAIRWNPGSARFEEWDGSAWQNLWTAATDHLSSTANPHSVTAAQVGAPTTATFNAHATSTTNPHNVTPGQIGALTASSNLSDVTNASTARTNLGAASSATLTSHTSNTSNPHSVTPGQIGALGILNNLSEITADSTARANIGAAAAGANSDISSMTAVSSIKNSGNITVENTTVGTSVIIKAGAAGAQWTFDSSGKLNAYAPPDYTPWPSGSGGYTTIRSINPAAATAADCANAINTIYQDLINLGLAQ